MTNTVHVTHAATESLEGLERYRKGDWIIIMGELLLKADRDVVVVVHLI